MCGIAGIIGDFSLREDKVNNALARMKNRGPDANGVYRGVSGDKNILFLHSRLAIIDLDRRSNQPFEDEDCVLTFNGEIYNYLELRDELVKLGFKFKTNSDTEVVVKAYRAWGTLCFDRFEGMWALALFDLVAKKILISRDRFGEKPLYYYKKNNALYFGSEVKFISALVDEKLKPNYDLIRLQLVYGFKVLFKESQETFFKHVFSLPPACFATITYENDVEIEKYWSLDYSPKKMSKQDVLDGARDCLEKSLNIRLRSDVPLAFCLSGGVDSSSLVAMAVRQFGYDAHTFSIVDKDKRYNEKDNIDLTVSELGCKHYYAYTRTDGFLDRLKKLVNYHDSPVATISYYIHSFLSEAIASHGYKVVISGTAADEIFTGYYDHYNFWLAEMSGQSNFSQLVEEWQKSYGKYVRNPKLKDPCCFVDKPDNREHIFLNNDVFNSLMIEPVDYTVSEENYTHISILRNRMLNELFHEIVPVILKEDDSNSMMWSIENRSPFLDSKLAEFMFTVPSEYLIEDGYVKSILRVIGSGLYPDRVRLDKQKKGFNASINSLLDLTCNDTRDYLLSDGLIYDIINKNKFEEFLCNDMTANSYSKFLFSFIATRMFLDSELVSGVLH